MGRKVVRNDENHTLKEPQVSYDTLLDPEMVALGLENTCFGDVYGDIAVGWLGPTSLP